MISMRIGNWKITDDAIQWSAKGFQRFVIEKELLLETVKQEPTYEHMYKWIIMATDEDWLTADDLYDLNFAFVFAAGSWQQELDYEIFDKTVEYQFDLLDEEEETQP
jgi:hypothetical protein